MQENIPLPLNKFTSKPQLHPTSAHRAFKKKKNNNQKMKFPQIKMQKSRSCQCGELSGHPQTPHIFGKENSLCRRNRNLCPTNLNPKLMVLTKALIN